MYIKFNRKNTKIFLKIKLYFYDIILNTHYHVQNNLRYTTAFIFSHTKDNILKIDLGFLFNVVNNLKTRSLER